MKVVCNEAYSLEARSPSALVEKVGLFATLLPIMLQDYASFACQRLCLLRQNGGTTRL
jgi:hypothetical protein